MTKPELDPVTFLKENMPNRDGHRKPGLLNRQKNPPGHEEFLSGLLTGNIRAVAKVKLETFGMMEYFVVCAFGNEHQDWKWIIIRQRLLPRLKKWFPIQESFGPRDDVLLCY